MKNPSSKKCQSRSKWTWNKTSLPVLYGFIADNVTVATNAQKNERHIVLIGKLSVISSSANRTPPIGLPNAVATPAAEAAVTISRILACEREKREKQPATTDPIEHATWTEGPSLPTERPDAIAIGWWGWIKLSVIRQS